ncbi:MAG: ABC transporter permease subunit [Bacillota bacterium]
MKISQMITVAEKELLEAIRSRWLITFTIVFALLALLISFFGMSGLGVGGGYQGFNRVTAGLLNLVLYLLPLIALVMGGAAVAGEKESGSLHVLLVHPVSKAEVIVGKFLGLGLALMAAILTGFGGAGIVIALKVGTMSMGDYLTFVILSMVLGLTFLSIALLLSVVTSRRAQAMGLAIFAWFLMVLVYDFLAIGVASMQQIKIVIPLLLTLLLLNPVDMVRVLVILRLGGETTFGPTLAALTRTISSTSGDFLLILVLFLWVVIPLILAVAAFGRRQDY